MATNHNININIGGSGTGKSNLKTSASRSVQTIKEKNTNKSGFSKAMKTTKTVISGARSGMGALKFAGIAGVTALAFVQTTDKAMDIYLDVKQASTGDQITVGNIKRIKKYVKNPVSYFVDKYYTYGLLQQRMTNRQNYENQYYRDLTGKAIVGNQYGQKR